MNEQQKAIYEVAGMLMSQFIRSVAYSDTDKKAWNRYCVEKAAALYDEVLAKVK